MKVSLNTEQETHLSTQLRSFHHRIVNHPAVYEKRVAFSRDKLDHLDPGFSGLSPASTRKTDLALHRSKAKRSMEDTCPSHPQWKILEYGNLRNGTRVTVYSQTYFYVTECLHNRGRACYLGVNAPLFIGSTQCKQKKSWVSAYVKQKNSFTYDWGFISVPTCCSCAIRR
ncbi:uncharacterized protein [Diadema setosum]|uniref:uncharacterized protein n=1 Tax=Diadema setosum TaxID=31175 RepID=UPI003B3AEA42